MGTHIKNGILYSSGFDFKPITRATYDALTESEKTKGAYVITDEDIQSTSADQVTYESGTVKDALDGTIKHSTIPINSNTTTESVNEKYKTATRITIFLYHGAGVRFSGDIRCETNNVGNRIQFSVNSTTYDIAFNYDRTNGKITRTDSNSAIYWETVSVDYI